MPNVVLLVGVVTYLVWRFDHTDARSRTRPPPLSSAEQSSCSRSGSRHIHPVRAQLAAERTALRSTRGSSLTLTLGRTPYSQWRRYEIWGGWFRMSTWPRTCALSSPRLGPTIWVPSALCGESFGGQWWGAQSWAPTRAITPARAAGGMAGSESMVGLNGAAARTLSRRSVLRCGPDTTGPRHHLPSRRGESQRPVHDGAPAECVACPLAS